ncbi:DEAD/DEAH box helicase [Enterovirga rhinocerotis]|uniref:DEAD-box ATP-dependent RNA helicase RhpA n=1 Tax=Enterovirga rhinocerotis TaxID=1339210 RepID=A0A4R7C694_9HYPH|nr:DEAD/DEAH box helicase [Enterovirga rhinocerotis]TDR93918.1 ATP-dependent RNA helicase RhlE [Enterovirga rhinocerotis]
MTSFQQFGLAAPILKALEEEGYESPTPIQSKAIPDVMAGRDLQGIAQTGTGKTAAFALPILHRLAADPKRPQPRSARVLVLSPTRELASQIAESFRSYGRHLRLSTTVVFGGVPIGRQQRALAGGVDVLVATPGRLLDLIDQRSLTLQGVEILVLDEADQMLDLGFIHALRRIVTLVPTKRQTLFFSATMPKSIEQLSAQFITDPVKVAVTPVATTAERIAQSVMFVSQGDKPVLLRDVLTAREIDRVLVFTRTKHGADRVVTQLDRSGIRAAAIHGNKSQGQRERALADFKAGRNRVLVATDIAARGIDVDGVSHVVNFDLPNVPESYVHRIGRTARAGAEGEAISFCNQEERAYLRDIEKLTRLKVPEADYPAGFVPSESPSRPVEEPARAPRGRGQRQGQGQGQGRPGNGGGRPKPAAQRSESGPARDRREGQGHERTPGPAQARGGGRPSRGNASTAGQGGGRREGGDIAWIQRSGPRSPR